MFMVYITQYVSPIGRLYICSQNNCLTGLWIENQKYFCSIVKDKPIQKDNIEIFNKTKKWLDKYFNKQNPKITNIKIVLQGSKFQQDVWHILTKIPYGNTTTYKNIAEIIAKKYRINKMSAQAVGGAVGHNPISIIVPCHRVIGVDGRLTGYAGGIDKKKYLLNLEQQ